MEIAHFCSLVIGWLEEKIKETILQIRQESYIKED